MKSLILLAHPSESSFSHKIAASYKEEIVGAGGKAEIIDLYTLNIPFHNKEKPLDDIKQFQEKIKESSEIIFVFPVWWGDGPAVLKNFLDNVLEYGFAYKKDESTGKIGGILNKKARIFATAGGPSFFYKIIFYLLWTKNRFDFCAIENLSTDILGNWHNITETKKTNFLTMVKVKARDSAANLR